MSMGGSVKTLFPLSFFLIVNVDAYFSVSVAATELGDEATGDGDEAGAAAVRQREGGRQEVPAQQVQAEDGEC